jgi:hypothetical protein
LSDKDSECKIEVWIEKDNHPTRSSSQKSEVQVYRSVGQVSAHALLIQIPPHPSNICLPRVWLIRLDLSTLLSPSPDVILTLCECHII